jgi:hypothetical protein
MFAAEELVFILALKRHGRFVVPPDFIVTSGRKIRTYFPGEILSALLGLGLRGPRSVRGRKGLELWYGERRHDPLHSDGQSKQN